MSELKRILLLEDEAWSAKLLSMRISHEWPGCDIIHVANKDDYIHALANDNFDIILSDYSIPEFSGLRALNIANKECPEVPFVFVSGTITDEVATESLKAGAVDYIFKDRPARLIPAIHRALDLAEARSHHVEHEELVNAVDGIVWQANQSTLQFIFVSKQAEQMLGYPTERWTNEPDFWQNHIHPDDKDTVVALCKNLTPEETHPDFEYRMIAADGRVVWLRDIVSVRVKKNRPPQIQGIMMDITNRKSAEEKIHDVQLKLEETNKDLVRRNQEIQNFYHVLSHELKTPLTSAREFVSMVLEGLAGSLNKAQLEYLGIAKDCCNQLRVCINDLLDTTRIETGKLSLQFTTVNLAEVAERAVKAMKSRAMERNIELAFQAQTDLPSIPADENRITQVLTNLIDNAFKFTPTGGQVSVEIREAYGHADFLQITVSDTGRGIPRKEQECIFDRLHQIKSGDASSGHGIGLGLYLCRELVWLHGGVIWVNSEEGKGSVFTFMLPKSQKRAQADVLVIDDDPDLLEMTKLMLSTEYNVRTGVDGMEGLKEIRRKVPDIIIMDLSMPNMNGVETLREIRDNWNTIPIIVYTAYSSSNLMKKAMEYSPFTLLSKPAEMNALLRAVRFVSLGINKDDDLETRIVDRPLSLDLEPADIEMTDRTNDHPENRLIRETQTN